jgi:hypothetical protein
MAYLLTGIFIILYIYGLFQWNKKVKWRLNPLVSKIIKYVHFFTLLISLSILVLNLQLDLGLRGLWTTRIIIITVLITGIFFIFLSNKSILNRFEKFYFKCFSFSPIVIAGTLLIPFIGVVMVVSLFGQLTSPANKIYYQDKNLRIQSSFLGVLGPPRLDIYEKENIFEKHLYRSDSYAGEFDSLKVKYDIDSTRVIFYRPSEINDSFMIICLRRIK